MVRTASPTSTHHPATLPLSVVGALILVAALWILGPLSSAVGLLTADPDQVRAALAGLGPFAPLASIGLNVLQGVIAPVPGFVIPFVNGVVFGTFWGTIVTWVGGVAAAAVCFTIARTVGRRFAERMCGRSRTLEAANRALEKHGLPAIVIARLLPGMPFDAFSYMGGLTRVRFSTFVLGTAIGSLPHAMVYSVVGAHLSVPLWVGLAVMPLIGLLVASVHWVVSRLRALPHATRRVPLAIADATLPRRTAVGWNMGSPRNACVSGARVPAVVPAYPEAARTLR